MTDLDRCPDRAGCTATLARLLACAAVCLLAGCAGVVWAQDAPTFRQLMNEGQRFRGMGNMRAASAKFSAAIDAAGRDDERVQALTAHAQVLQQLGQEERAEEALHQAVGLDVPLALRRMAVYQLAALLQSSDRVDEAVQLYRSLAEEAADQPGEAADALLAAARLLVRSDRCDEAQEILGQLPRDELPEQQRIEAANLVIEVLIAAGEVGQARQTIEESPLGPEQKAQLLARIARALFDQKKDDEAAQACQAALEADPQLHVAWRIDYEIAQRKGTTDELEAKLVALVEQNPDNPALIERLASFAEWNDNPARALEVYRRLIAIRKDDPYVLERAGALAAGAGLPQDALEFYQEALRLQPQDTSIYYMIGEAQAKLGHGEEALAAWKKGTSFEPGDEQAARRLGAVLSQHGLHEQAVGVYDECRRARGDFSILASERAEALAALGRTDEALGEYLSAAEVSVDAADTIAPEAVKLARESDLTAQLTAQAQTRLDATGAPGLALLVALAAADSGEGPEAVEGPLRADLSADDLLTIAEALEFGDHREAAGRLYAAVADHDGLSPGLRLEMGLRAAEIDVAAGRPDAAADILRRVTQGSPPPRQLLDQARFLLADIGLSTGGGLAEVQATFESLLSGSPEVAQKARWRLADCVFAAGDFARAEALYNALRDEAPATELPMPPLPPGATMRISTMMPSAVMVDDLPGTDPRMTPAYAASQIAECAFRSGDLERAKALFAAVAEAFPESIYANDAVERRAFIASHFAQKREAADQFLTALAASRGEDWQQAIRALGEIADMGPGEPLADDAALLIASTLEQHGRTADAAATYRELGTHHPASLLVPVALLSAARLSYRLDQAQAAEEDLNALVRNFPAAPMARTAALWLDDLQHGRPLTTATD